MKVLVINCGSSSLKFKLYDLPADDTATFDGRRPGRGNRAREIQVQLSRQPLA